MNSFVKDHIALIVAFTIGTIGIIYFSWWLSLKARRYHGIARFFAFESLLLMLLLNIGFWFRDPFCIRQIFSWLFLTGGIFPALQGYLLLRRVGKPGDRFEDTSNLVRVGIYKYIRHPLYGSLIMLGIGIFLKNPTHATTALLILNTLALICTAKIEEGEMVRKFGDEYTAYMKETRMFVPYVI